MSTLFRFATLGAAALLAGTADAHAQAVIVQEPAYAAPAYVAPDYVAPGYVAPGYVATAPVVPAAPVIAPAPAVVAEPAPIYAQERTYIAPAAPIVTQPQTIVMQPTERVQETVVQRSASQPTTIRRSARTARPRVHLTNAQRRDVLRTIRYERTAAPAVTTAASYSIGSVLPATVPTYAMPQQVVYEAPALRSYAYAPVGNRVLLVEPASNMVVDELY